MLSYSPEYVPLLDYIKCNGITVHDNVAIQGIYANTGLYGLGWIYKNVNGIDLLYHTGKTSTFTSISVLIPQKNLTITILCNMGDFFVGTNLIEKLYEGVISIALESNEIPSVDKYKYLKQHSIINLILLTLFFISILPFILYVFRSRTPRTDLLSICKFSLLHMVVPIFLLCIFPLIQIPYTVGFDFAPDILFVLAISSLNLFLTGGYKLILMCLKH